MGALRAYHDVFFAEEERRIRPALQAALSRAQERAENAAARSAEGAVPWIALDERPAAPSWCWPLPTGPPP